MSGQTSRPWNQSSSPVFTTTVTSSGGTTWTSPRRKRAAPTPPASAVSTLTSVAARERASAPRRGPRQGGFDAPGSGSATHELASAGGTGLDGLHHLCRHGLDLPDERLDALLDVTDERLDALAHVAAERPGLRPRVLGRGLERGAHVLRGRLDRGPCVLGLPRDRAPGLLHLYLEVGLRLPPTHLRLLEGEHADTDADVGGVLHRFPDVHDTLLGLRSTGWGFPRVLTTVRLLINICKHS